MLSQTLLVALLTAAMTSPEPNEANFAQWRDFLRPKQSELSFEESKWKPSLWEAVVESQQTGKPILLWAMNGHPLACT
ncbi:MAG TPA: hypothetical protein VK934_13440 [Fimbriimonas sp.]|nr:hypothetical protein [Fimbriimonas sp.]